MREAIDEGVLAVEEHGIELMYDVQPHQAVKKQGLNARLKAIRDSGFPEPVFRNLRLDEAQAQRDRRFFDDNYEGTRARIGKGANRERLA